MFIGHFGVALAAKKVTPRTSLGSLFFAAQFLDLLWPLFLLLGWEHVRIAPGITRMTPMDFYDYPITHSFVMAVAWSAVVGTGYYFIRKNARDAWVMGVAVVSHWILDVLVHRPDLPVWPGGPKVGLGLWNSWVLEILLEIAIFATGAWFYCSVTRARDQVGRFALWTLFLFLIVSWVASLSSAPPPNERAVAWVTLSMWILVPWAWWADRHRETVV